MRLMAGVGGYLKLAHNITWRFSLEIVEEKGQPVKYIARAVRPGVEELSSGPQRYQQRAWSVLLFKLSEEV